MSILSAVLQEVEKASTQDFKKHRDVLLPKVRDLNEKIQMLSFALHQNFIDTHFNFTVTKSLEQLNYKNRKGNIVSDHKKIQEEIKSLQDKFEIDDEEFNGSCEKLNASFISLKDLCVVVEAKRVLDLANHEFGRYNYCHAMLSIKELQRQLLTLKFDGNAAQALSNLKAQAENQLALYSAHLSVEWEDIFIWSEKKSVSICTYSLSVQQSDPILLQNILKTLYETERLNAELGVFSHFFINDLIHNVIRYNCDIFTDDNIGAIVFNIKINLNDANKPNYQTIFNNLTAVFDFLQATLGSQLPQFIEIFSKSIQSKFFNKMIEECIRDNLPSCESSYENYQNLVIELDSFNKFLIDLKFVKPEESPFNKFISDTECILYNKKCDKLLSDVRNLLKESLTYGTLVVGSSSPGENETVLDVSHEDVIWELNKPLFLPKCVISQNVKKIMTKIIEHLEESVKLPEKYSRQLVMYIKDIALLYQCIVPKKFKANLECCPLDLALFFNNCFYLAHALLGPPWRTILPTSLADLLALILLECIQDLRVLGLEKMSLYLQNQKSIIISNIEPDELPPWSHESFEQFDSAINEAVNMMKDLKDSWHNILPTRMYELSMCTLIQVICQSALQRIMGDSRPVSEELVYMLALRLEDTVQELVTMFEEPIEFEKKISIWTKFLKLPQLLKGQLLEIADLWNKSNDLCQSYTCEEVRQIIKMRFPDNKYRLKILKEIQ